MGCEIKISKAMTNKDYRILIIFISREKLQMKYIVLVILFLTLFPACKKDNLVIPDTGRKIVINGFISSDSLLNVRISKSAFISENSPDVDSNLTSLSNACVYIYQNNTKIDSLHYESVWKPKTMVPLSSQTWFHFGNYRSKNVFPLPGTEYKIVVKTPGLPDATASTIIPNLVRIKGIDSSRFTATEDPSMPYKLGMKFNIGITDPENETNYYLFSLWKTPSRDNNRNLLFNCNDPIVEERISFNNNYAPDSREQFWSVAFTDKLINGQKYRLEVTVLGTDIGKPFYDNGDIPNGHRKVIYFRLYSITKECFMYIQTINLYNRNYGNPLGNPVTVYSNIIGGYGILAGAAVATDSIVFKY